MRQTRIPFRAWALAVGALSLLAAQPAAAQSCIDGNTAASSPRSLWGTLKPGDRVDTGGTGSAQLPPNRDSTDYTGQQLPNFRYPLFSSLDIENGYVFMSYSFGMQIWDARGTNARDPQLISSRDGFRCGEWPAWPTPCNSAGEARWLVWDIDAPAGKDSVVVTAGSGGVGTAIWNTANKNSPAPYYQDTGGAGQDAQVWVGEISGRDYAFVTSTQNGRGVLLYDVTAAQALGSSTCLEDTLPGGTRCSPNPNVYLGRFGILDNAYYIDGMRRTSDGKTFVAFSSGVNPRGVEIYNVSNPTPTGVVNLRIGGGRFLSGNQVHGVAMWQQGSKQYLGAWVFNATANQYNANIYDLTGCLDGSCAELPSPLFTLATVGPIASSRYFLTYSQANGSHYLYLGHDGKCLSGTQKEYLFDLSSLPASAPTDLFPDTLAPFQEGTNNPVNLDYAGWYYANNPGGPNNVGHSQFMPRAGKFNDNVFYRAAWTVFDTHERANVSPSITLSGPSTGFTGDAIAFSAVANNCTPATNGWSWVVGGGGTGAGTSSTANLIWGTTGIKTVTVTNSGCAGAQGEATINIADAAPAVGSVTASPNPATVCTPITFTANNVTGRPPLTFTWVVKQNGSPVAGGNGNGNPFVWNTNGVLAGSYEGEVTVSGVGTAVASGPVVLTTLPSLPLDGQFTPTTDPFAAGTVQFHVNAPGATEWKWDFGDGTTPVWTNDPVNGPNPVHTYTTTGNKVVTVQVRNCLAPTPVTSAALNVNILQTTPLVALFNAQGCALGFCTFNPGATVTFTNNTQGADGSSQYFYDWTHTTQDEGSCNFPVTGSSSPTTSRVFSSSGTFYPCLKVTRGSESDIHVHSPAIIITSAPPPPPPTATISISGPSSMATGVAGTFTGNANNCSPNATGWNWGVAGGTVTGANNTSTIQITWSSAGSKTVTATNSGCSGASGTRSVTITGSTGTTLASNFTFSPATPAAGQEVSFDGSSSTGSPTTYLWTFPGNVTKTGAQVTHSFPASGVYTVKLDVSKPDSSCSFNLCSATISKTVAVGGGGSQVVASFLSSACTSSVGLEVCIAQTGQAVNFTSNSTGVDGSATYSWAFGDGGTATGAAAQHTFSQPGTYSVALTVNSGGSASTATKSHTVNRPTTVASRAVLLPWIAQTSGALEQTSDLYVHNPGTGSMDVLIRFLKRGIPEPNPPEVRRTIAAGATLYLEDVVGDLFNRGNLAGFLFIEPQGSGTSRPVVTSFNRTFQEDGRVFGQVIPGVPLDSTGTAVVVGEPLQHLAGLNDNAERTAYFGISNPNPAGASYNLKFVDHNGVLLAQTTSPLTIAANAQKQFQVEEIRTRFGLSDEDDYRVEIRLTDGGPVYPYGANLRLGSDDPAFVLPGRTGEEDVYLIGALSTPGLNNSNWKTDLVLANTSTRETLTEVSFTPVGASAVGTDSVEITLQPGETRRLVDVLQSQWAAANSIGVLRVLSDNTDNIFPVVQAETYDTGQTNQRYGQFMGALTTDEAATTTKPRTLVGLRQDVDHRTTVWVFNPGNQSAEYTLRYRNLQGAELGVITGQFLGPGKMRQLSPAQHPLPAAGVVDGFTVEVSVRSGSLLAAAQVVNKDNDPAYITGQ